MEVSKSIFKGLTFVLSGFVPSLANDLTVLITDYSGNVLKTDEFVGSVCKPQVFCLICTFEEIKDTSLSVKQANTHKIPIVNEIFLYESIVENSLQSFSNFPVVEYKDYLDLEKIYPIDKRELLSDMLSTFETKKNPEIERVLNLLLNRDLQVTHKRMLCFTIPEEIKTIASVFKNNPSLFDFFEKLGKTHMDSLKLVKLLCVIIETNYHILDTELIEQKILGSILDMFLENPLENIPHRLIVKIFVEIFQNHHLFLQKFLLEKKNLIDLILNKFNDDFLRPHLTQIGNVIFNVTFCQKTLGNYLQKKTEWKIFFSETLPEINTRNDVKGWVEEIPKRPTTGGKLTDSTNFLDIPIQLVVGSPRRRRARVSCGNCGKLEAEEEVYENRCPRCGKIFYCSRECQKNHWKGVHKDKCSV